MRPRTVHEMKVTLLDDHPGHFILRLKTQAGTYVKEFVHGDFNRTVPNLCILLGRPVDIVALDVDAVELDWPPALFNWRNNTKYSKTINCIHVEVIMELSITSMWSIAQLLLGGFRSTYTRLITLISFSVSLFHFPLRIVEVHSCQAL